VYSGRYFHRPHEEAVKQYFFENDIESDQEIILRREISANGKSRAFINDTPVNLSQMQKLASLLVDLHRQFDARELGEDHFQLQVLDALAGQVELRKEYNRAFNVYIKSKQQEEFLQKQKADALKEYDYHLFLFNELEEASFKEDEIEELEAELNILSHAEQVNAALAKTEATLDGDEQSMARDLKSLVQTWRQSQNIQQTFRYLLTG
jgi:DNA repair protein RecN (Recombination protein N)